MKHRRVLLGVGVLGLLLILVIGPGFAQDPEERGQPQGIMAIEGIVGSKFTYQGLLREDGAPVSGTRDMTFQPFTDSACTVVASGSIAMPGVVVSNGLFSVEVSVSDDLYSGSALWLGVAVEGTAIGCQEILPVPYALSLRPGARIEGEMNNWDALHIVNTARSGSSYGLYSVSRSTVGRGVMAYATAASGANYGLYARTESAEGVGVYARGLDGGADLVLAGNADTLLGDDGRISSDPSYPSVSYVQPDAKASLKSNF